MRKLLPVMLVLGLCLGVSNEAQAAGFYGPRGEHAPSVFTYAWRGLTLGSLIGVSAGYLIARRDGLEREDWQPVLYGLGFGALGGAAVGLTLGFVDLADDNPGMGNLALRDMMYGAELGVLAGAIVGGLVVIRSHEAEHILFGAAIGALAGASAGLIIGIIEGRRIITSPSHRYSGKLVQPALATTRDADQRLVWLAGVSGRF